MFVQKEKKMWQQSLYAKYVLLNITFITLANSSLEKKNQRLTTKLCVLLENSTDFV